MFKERKVNRNERGLSIDKTFIILVGTESIEELPTQITIDGKIFNRKNKLHITVVGYPKGKVFKKIFAHVPEFETQVNALIQRCDWSYTLQNEYFHITQNIHIPREFLEPGQEVMEGGSEEKPLVHRESVVQLIDIPGVKIFFEELQNLVEAAIASHPELKNEEIPVAKLYEFPKPHITIYAHNGSGIGINSEQEWEQLHPTPLNIESV